MIHKYKLSLNINAKKLYDLVESIDNIPEVEYKKGFWSIVENYHLDNINALSSVNGCFFLNENINFFIKLKIKTICSICNKIQDYDIFNSALILITKSDFNFINIYKKIMSLKLTKFGSYDICIKNTNNNNDNNQYASLLFNCKTILVLNLNLPKILFFNSKFCDKGESEDLQYNNLISLKEQYKYLFLSSFTFKNNIYKLKGTINLVSINHKIV